MAKTKTVYECTSCGHSEPKWLGRCPECGEWNTFREAAEGGASDTRKRGAGKKSVPLPLGSIQPKEDTRFASGIDEIDRVLGGGIMKGSTVIIGGEPGIGKSTLMAHIAGRIRSRGRVLYVSGEESAEQLKLRADRLGIEGPNIEILCETDLDQIVRTLDAVKPVLCIVDSLQTLVSAEAGAIPGTVNQIKYCCYEISDWARNHGAAAFFVAHVTKEGSIAGPKVVEHMVDTVLYFDQAESDTRIVRATKNRFGSIDEIGLFTMTAKGLVQVKDPSHIFMQEREGDFPPGVTVAPVYEGSRILLVEIQALTVPAKGSMSRVFSDRIDSGRVSRVAAVLEKHLDLRFSDHDIYVNVAGGIRINEVGIELPLASALYSARTGIPVPAHTAVAGEISLAGEIRPIPHLQRRIRAAAELGFTNFVGPAATADDEGGRGTWRRVSRVRDGIGTIFGKG